MTITGIFSPTLAPKFTEFQTKKIPYSEKLQKQTVQEQKQLAAKKHNGLITADEENRFKNLREQMQANRKKIHDEMLTILTPEQKTQLDQMRTEMREKMKERRMNRGEKKPETPKDN